MWDDNGSGSINLLEFAEIVRDLQVFEQFDIDRSGHITVAELRAALGKLGVHMSVVTPGHTQDLLDKYDDDKSGVIEFPEFRRLANDLPSLSSAARPTRSLACTMATQRRSAPGGRQGHSPPGQPRPDVQAQGRRRGAVRARPRARASRRLAGDKLCEQHPNTGKAVKP